MSRRCLVLWCALAAVVVVACTEEAEPTTEIESSAEADQPAPSQPADTPPDPPEPSVAPVREPCRHDGLETAPTVSLIGDDPVEVSYRIAERTHRCAPIAVIAPVGSWATTLAVPVAASVDAPLLLVDPQAPEALVEVLDTLEVQGVITVGMGLTGLGRPGTALQVGAVDVGDAEVPDTREGTHDLQPEDDEPAEAVDDEGAAADGDVRLALLVAEHLGVHRFVAVREDDVRGRTAAALRVDGSNAILPVPDDTARIADLAQLLPPSARLDVVSGPNSGAVADELLAVGIDAEVAADERWPAGDETTWLVDPDQPDVGALAVVAAAGREEAVLPVDGADLRADATRAGRLRSASPERSVLVGDLTSDADWQLELVLTGPTLPGGGFRLFEDERIVALYGHPGTAALGALGEQDLDATVERVLEVATPYAADGKQVLPAFEIIATVASSTAGQAGDYSTRTDIEDLRPYVDRAAEEGFYVILDLQPGRTDFLDQAQEYEELLLEPHVGLALDPEWRIGDDEVHLQRIGHVEVDEVQRVADWLAELTRQNNLPQKLLLLHQFTHGMLPDRDDLAPSPELAVVIHMDGQGALPTKFDTYAAITRNAEDRWTWGWKNFYDEDAPVATPEQILDLYPLPMLVTYQ